MARQDDFENRRKHLASLSDQQLKERFWELAEQVVSPLLELARTHTSPSIERSILLRMGFSSLEAKGIVEQCSTRGLLGKGAGNAVWLVSRAKNIPLQEAGQGLAQGNYWDELKFRGGEQK